MVLRVVAGNHQAAVHNRVGTQIVLIETGVEIAQPAVLLAKWAVIVEAQTKGQGQSGRQLDVVLGKGSDLVARVVAFTRTLEEAGKLLAEPQGPGEEVRKGRKFQ